jgi:hypothetical protein
MHAGFWRAVLRAAVRRTSSVAVLTALLAGCSGPQVVKGMPPNEGMHLFVRAPARQVVERLPQALAPAGFELREVYTQGPPLWEAVALLPAGIVGDGQWARITVKEVGPQVCLVRTYTALRGGGVVVEDPNATARNLLVNVFLVNSPEVQAAQLAELRRAALQGGGEP